MTPFIKAVAASALAGMMLVVLTGCPSLIANIVGAGESLQRALASAQAGDTIRFMGQHQENVVIAKDGITLVGDTPDATIQGTLTIQGNNVTTSSFTVDGDMTIDGNGGRSSNMTITGVLDTPPGSMEDHIFTSFGVGGWGSESVDSFGMGDVQSQATFTLNGTFSCDTIVQPSESIQDAIDDTAADADRRPICVAPATRSVAATDPNGPPLTIDKSIDLQALVPGEAVLEVSYVEPDFDPIVEVQHDNVRLAGFAITTVGGPAGTGVSVQVQGADANVELTDLDVRQTFTGLEVAASGVQVTNSTIAQSGTGVVLSEQDNVVSGSTIQLNEVGIASAAPTGQNTVTESNIVDNDVGIDHASESSGPDLMAEGNWFGAADGPEDTSFLGEETTGLAGDPANCTGNPALESNSTGSGDDVNDTDEAFVDYCPWVTSSIAN